MVIGVITEQKIYSGVNINLLNLIEKKNDDIEDSFVEDVVDTDYEKLIRQIQSEFIEDTAEVIKNLSKKYGIDWETICDIIHDTDDEPSIDDLFTEEEL